MRSNPVSTRTAYLAPDGFLPELLSELAGNPRVLGRLVVTDGPERPAAWAENVWRDVQEIPILSIGDGARKLKAIQRNWALYSVDHHRRAALIADALPKVSAKPLEFGAAVPTAPLGSWTLVEPGLILAAPACSSPFPNGVVRFVENRNAPPSRAYLKLWEALTVIGAKPQSGDLCLDLGASPGGWTWVLAGLGAQVIAVDKAPIDPDIKAMPGVTVRTESAFGLDPAREPPVDWLFSDVICYPERLLGLVQRWLATGRARRFVCTIKFQGATDHATAQRFAAIPGSRLLHLHNNKHELTWVKL
jgi:23S rRNA (cytidine2498-2'-O)-methyltransferase